MSGPSPASHHNSNHVSDSIGSTLRKQPVTPGNRSATSGISDLVRQFGSNPERVQFQTTTIRPSPPMSRNDNSDSDSAAATTTTTTASRSSFAEQLENPANALRISTDIAPPPHVAPVSSSYRELLSSSSTLSPCRIPYNRTTSSSSVLLGRSPSLKGGWANGNGSVNGSGSFVSSPVINAMGDVTPLPSPLMSSDSPGPWKRLSNDSNSPPQRRNRLSSLSESTSTDEATDATAPISPKRKLYISTDVEDKQLQPTTRHHTRNRSISDYTPDAFAIHRRPLAVSGSHAPSARNSPQEPSMRRETNLAESRGLTPTVDKPPTPPPSESSRDPLSATSTKPKTEYFQAKGRYDDKQRRWRCLGLLGRGTFSRVMLATSQVASTDLLGELPASSVADCDLPRKTLVAVKVCEHGPRGGASEDRVEMSLKRELEIMQVIRHPSLVDLKAWSIERTRAILVMSYCPGGDLFDVATTSKALLTPDLVRRIFSELIAAVSYLHEQNIVHRDIKLENVLVNVRPKELASASIDWSSYPHSVITLADMGLSRRVANGEQLETRCGSEDYAAPEVIMGQPYDGYAIDAWSLGVLLYALLEARLPFDPHPSMSDAHRMRSRTSHRIARVEWRWVEYAGDDGDHECDEAKFERRGLLGAMEIVEGLLKRARARWTIRKVAAMEWVTGGMVVEGGLKFREEDDGEEV